MALSSQDLQNIIAGVAIAATFIVYSRRRIDARHDAARIILYEIEQAESRFDDALGVIDNAENLTLHDRVQLLPQNSWSDSRKQLIKVLPSDVIKRINQFYNDCELLDSSLRQIDEMFLKNETEVRVNAFRVNADYFKTRVDNFIYEKDDKDDKSEKQDLERINKEMIIDANNRREYFNKEFPTLYSYAPVKPINDGRKIVARLRDYNLSQSRAGDYLRKNGASWFFRLISKSK